MFFTLRQAATAPQTYHTLGARGKPSTWFPRGRPVETESFLTMWKFQLKSTTTNRQTQRNAFCWNATLNEPKKSHRILTTNEWQWFAIPKTSDANSHPFIRECETSDRRHTKHNQHPLTNCEHSLRLRKRCWATKASIASKTHQQLPKNTHCDFDLNQFPAHLQCSLRNAKKTAGAIRTKIKQPH